MITIIIIHEEAISSMITGRARLIRSFTQFEVPVSMKSLPDSYYFMFKMHS